MTSQFDLPQSDDLNDLINAPIDAAKQAKVAQAEQTVGFTEKCPKCRGRGQFVSYSGRVLGECFACKGKGSKTFKTSSIQRQQGRNAKAQTLTNKIVAFNTEHPRIAEWLRGTTFEPALRIAAKLAKYGSIFDTDIAFAYRCIEKRDAALAARVETAPTVDAAGIDKLKAAFDKAIAYTAKKGLKLSPRLTIGGLTISPAKATSANAGALYVKSSGGAYLGKIANGKLYGTADCTPELTTKIQAFVCEPAEAAKVYGQTTGTCCVCNATLRSEWKLRGIGPVCAEKFGW